MMFSAFGRTLRRRVRLKKRILGIDPGSHKCGWGIIDVTEGGHCLHVDNGLLQATSKESLAKRLHILCDQLQALCREYTPSVAVIENVFVHRSAKSALILGQARGAILVELSRAGMEVVEMASTQAKLQVAGHGRATKAQIADRVSRHLGLSERPFEDAADALAIALAYGMQSPLQLRNQANQERSGSRSPSNKRGRNAWAELIQSRS